ncbi:FG-GAP-like repeat-containing protein [Confluentibacter lentus]|uniref:FG-GAP-like repeat-containing protein n=1 Tax=Confluentibacter lentus TaxID=1699412 RepID=UPI000C28B526|nr:FG-GAP-like repeat-containing protein [Confluentibacter lentus]
MKTFVTVMVFFWAGCIGFSQNYKELQDLKAMAFIPDYLFEGSKLDNWKPIGSAKWSANNGSVIGKINDENESGILVFSESYQDVAFQVSTKRNSTVEIGLLFRFEKKDDGFNAVLLSVDPTGNLASFNIRFDAQGNEVEREKLARAGGLNYRIAPPVKETTNQTQTRRPNSTPPPVPSDLPVKQPNTEFVNGEWNQLEAYVDVNTIRAFMNDGREVGGTMGEEKNEDGYGPVALFIKGKGEVQFKNIMLKDASIKETPLEMGSDRFKIQRISDMYYSWAVDAADYNKDGNMDVVAGPYLYYGPDFTKRSEIFPAIAASPSLEFAYNRVQDTYDFNNDGWPDIISSAFATTLYINPKGEHRRWKSYNILPDARVGEITALVDIDKDGKPELIYGANGHVRYAKPNENNPTETWIEYNVSDQGYHLAHGIGTGDINGDGRIDILNPAGWWEQPAVLDSTKTWKYHPVAFGRYGKRSGGIGGSIMAVYDVNGNGLNDVVTNLNVHGFGLAWFEQKRNENGDISFVQHMISDDYQFDNNGGVTFSQAHGATFADIDGDGIKDYIVGKRYFTHLDNYLDPDPYGPPVLYWYKTVRNKSAPGGAELIPELIHNRSGVGSEINAVDLDKNGTLDVITSTNNGTFIYWNNTKD